MLSVVAMTFTPIAGTSRAGAVMSNLCTGYSGCVSLGMTDHGYGSHSGPSGGAGLPSYWGNYTGHNCTNYVAYLFASSYARPAGLGNANTWGSAFQNDGFTVDMNPSPGAIAWWDSNRAPASASGHVAYVESVSGSTVTVSEDSWDGDFNWATMPAGTPSGYIHFHDVPLSPPSTPAAPVVSASSSGSPSITVSWSPPASSGSATVKWYDIQDNQGHYCGVIQQSLSMTFPGAKCGAGADFTPQPGTSYSFSVRAYSNYDGNGGTSAWSPYSAPVTVGSPPGPPTSVSGTPQTGAVAVTWTAPVSNGGISIDSYTVTATPGGQQCSATTTTCVVNGLTNGTAYTFAVTAHNAAGTSSASQPSAAITPTGVPSAPLTPSAAAGNASATITWSPPSSTGGLSILSYNVTSTPVSAGCTTTSTSCVVNGLTNGTAYTFAVVASNAKGPSSSATATAVTPATTPGAPTSVTAASVVGGATVSWSVPSSTGGLPISSYTATATPGGKSCTSAATSCTISSLTPRSNYVIVVTASNGAGTGPVSASASVTVGSPSTPVSLEAHQADLRELTVTWRPGAATGVASKGYHVTVSPGGATCATTVLTQCAFTNLSKGTYTFTVSAFNALGTSPVSAPVSATVVGVPSQPMGVSVTAGDSSATVHWSQPTDTGDGISDYQVSVTPGTASCVTADTSCTLTGLTNGTHYAVTVVADDSFGSSVATVQVTVVPGAPGAPTAVKATAGNASALVQWTAPTGGGQVTSYTATASPGGKSCTVTVPAVQLQCPVTGLVNGQSYTFLVTATNSFGQTPASAPSAAVSPLAPPPTPTSVQATAGNASATVSWSMGTGATVATSYTATASPGGKSCTIADPTTTCIVTGLTPGLAYTFSVVATNQSGTSGPSAPSASVSLANVPSSPTAVTVVAGDTNLTVSWTASNGNGSPVTTYTATATATPNGSCSTATTTCTISGLTDGQAYSVTVTATNAVGTSASSAPSAAVTPSGMPGVPGGLHQTNNSQSSVTLQWSDANTNGAPIDKYQVRNLETGYTCTVAAGQGDTCVVGGLNAGTAYTFQVQAHNANGWSSWSGSVGGSTQAAPPTTFTEVAGPSGSGLFANSNTGNKVGTVGAGGSITVSCMRIDTTTPLGPQPYMNYWYQLTSGQWTPASNFWNETPNATTWAAAPFYDPAVRIC